MKLDPDKFRSELLAWYGANARKLPWRQGPSLYRTVVSEFMLQQTQVKTVIPYFDRWMAKLPDFAALARAPGERVLKLWEGLGYYGRARNLHRLARALVAAGEIPEAAEDWLELPGVGPYTAAAVTSISFHAPAACVDGNVVRILARITGDATRHRDSASAARALAPLAQRLLSVETPGEHNQAMMELGATVCLPRNPLCGQCPVSGFCKARRLGKQEDYPRLARRKSESRRVVRVWCERRSSLLLHRAARDSRRLAGLHELPTAEQAGVRAKGKLLAKRRRGITRFRIEESIYKVAAPKGRLRDGLVWVPFSKLGAIALSGPHRRWVTELLGKRATRRIASRLGPRSAPLTP